MASSILRVAAAAIEKIVSDSGLDSIKELRKCLTSSSRKFDHWEVFAVGKCPDPRLQKLWDDVKVSLLDEASDETYISADDLLQMIDCVPEKVLPKHLIPVDPHEVLKAHFQALHSLLEGWDSAKALKLAQQTGQLPLTEKLLKLRADLLKETKNFP
jgi:hypothetical protein